MFSMELLGEIQNNICTDVDEIPFIEFTIPSKICINGIPIIQANGKPEIALFLPGDFVWLLDVIEGKREYVCLMDFGTVIHFKNNGTFFSK